MKKQVFYIHGGESFLEYDSFLNRLNTRQIWDLPNSPYKRKWTDTLALDLGDEYEVFTPQMPNKQNAKFTEWSIWFERHFEHLHDGVVLMGCSLGAMFLLRYLSEHGFPYKIKALFVLAAAVHMEGYDDSDSGDFVCELDSISSLQDRVESIFILHSHDDFMVPFEHALKLNSVLPQAKLIAFENKGHFLGETFPELVEEILGVG